LRATKKSFPPAHPVPEHLELRDQPRRAVPILAVATPLYFACLLSTPELFLTIHRKAPGTSAAMTAIRWQHWEFLFVLAFAIGLHGVHRLTLIQEGGQISERAVVQELVLELRRSKRSLSSVSDPQVGTGFAFGRIIQPRQAAI
jgi:hypothetical protein